MAMWRNISFQCYSKEEISMMKRVLALLLCLVTVLLCVTACAKNENDKGAFIRMYLAEPIYDFDPLKAYDNANTLMLSKNA